ncbi:peptidoglycan-binding protein LysM [Aromatoleum bremense]|uniref:Peptidoglycan-binding protein LysM n=1 Tax=Aromatoleum bremense TaxID=76115 RepID=A0ABX1NPP3_9RHOO|nr:peptidoglycan-binding protein LysM [Aromatoleum bremense]NMG13950.1 peptidoglycan-binding protein LysM [Aromatoleum bremense]QTQ31874.1 BON/LysM domain-containing protein [Aromatoleum bremense]
MGLFSFIKDAGEKLFGGDEAKAAAPAAPANAAAPATADASAANAKAAEAIKQYIMSMNLAPSDLGVKFDAATSVVTVSGTAPDQATKEKILLAAGNVRGVERVDDRLSVPRAEPEARFHIVASGDTLSAISKKYYGDANKYNAIFEANKPMLTHPDKIYPGQVLRIPPQG